MAGLSVSDIVFVSFPFPFPFLFSDLRQQKLRPALLLADAQRGDWVLCQVTSRAYADTNAIRIDARDFVSGGLSLTSYFRPAKIFTANEGLIQKQVGRIKAETHAEVVCRIQRLMQEGK